MAKQSGQDQRSCPLCLSLQYQSPGHRISRKTLDFLGKIRYISATLPNPLLATRSNTQLYILAFDASNLRRK